MFNKATSVSSHWAQNFCYIRKEVYFSRVLRRNFHLHYFLCGLVQLYLRYDWMEAGRFTDGTLQSHSLVPWSYALGVNNIIRKINQSLPDVSLRFLFTFWKVKAGILYLGQSPSPWTGEEKRSKSNWQPKLLQAHKPHLFLRKPGEIGIAPVFRWRNWDSVKLLAYIHKIRMW